MKLLIAADLEGITGVVDWNHVRSDQPEYPRFRRMMTEDINAAIRGAFQAGADEVIVTDGHGPKTNILIEALDPRARLNSGTGPLAMAQGVDSGVDAAFFIGYHARAGALNAILCHTVSSATISNVWLNDRLVGEIGMIAAVCGHFNIPVLLVSGDRAACLEAQETVPGVDVVVTKQASGQWAAECLPAEVTHPMIERAATEAVRKWWAGQRTAPAAVSAPARFTVKFIRPSMADRASLVPGAERLDGRRVAITGATVPLAYQFFRSAMILASE